MVKDAPGGEVTGTVEAQVSVETGLVVVTVTDQDPKAAADLANSYADATGRCSRAATQPPEPR